jgi:Type I restriction modification DNA specificity domain.
MEKLSNLIEFTSGSPQFRITESTNERAPTYHLYSQTDLLDDLVGATTVTAESKQIKTANIVSIVNTGDVIFSLISGTSAIVHPLHEGYLYTQNYIKLTPTKELAPNYLVYILNIDPTIKRQLITSLQGSQVLKYTLRQIKDLVIPDLPPLKQQKLIGNIYLKQLRLEALRKNVAILETKLVLQKLKEDINNE